MTARLVLLVPFLAALGCGSEPAAEPDPLADGWRAARAGEHAESAAAYGEATEAEPQNITAWLGLAREKLRAGDPSGAAAAAERAVALDDSSADAHEVLGLARLRGDEPEAAATELARALELDEARVRDRFPLARAFERSEQLDEAVEAYRAAADAGAQPARALAAAARVRLDALGNETAPDSVIREVETLLDRAEEAAREDDDAVRGAIVAQRRRLERARSRDIARNAGVLAVLRELDGSPFGAESPYGRADSLGDEPTNALGSLTGDSLGENAGFGGLGLRGSGGSGGTGEGTIGLGNLGTIGDGSGSGYGSGAGGLRGRRATVPRVRIGEVTVVGGLAREVARRVLRRHINEVRFCYEQAVTRDPELAGDVTLQLVVSPQGSVAASTVSASSLGNPSVEGCVARAGRRWTFPAPDGGGIARVNAAYALSTAD